MDRRFEVVGDYGGPMPDYPDYLSEGYDEDELGSVMGIDEDGMEVVGVVPRSASRARIQYLRRHPHAPAGMVRVWKPHWRERQLAPGVIAPDQGLLPLPLSATANNGQFDVNYQTLTFEGQLQKPFRGERLLVTTDKTGTVVPTNQVLGQLFVGTDLQQLDVPPFNVEQVGQVQGFGIRLTMKPAQPGVFIRVLASLSGTALSSDQVIATEMTILGRLIH